MSQSEILDFLSQHPGEWYTANELSEELKLEVTGVRLAIRRLELKRMILSKYRMDKRIKKSVKCVCVLE